MSLTTSLGIYNTPYFLINQKILFKCTQRQLFVKTKIKKLDLGRPTSFIIATCKVKAYMAQREFRTETCKLKLLFPLCPVPFYLTCRNSEGGQLSLAQFFFNFYNFFTVYFLNTEYGAHSRPTAFNIVTHGYHFSIYFRIFHIQIRSLFLPSSCHQGAQNTYV